MISRLARVTRLLVVVPVLGCLLGAVALVLYAAGLTITLVADAVTHSEVSNEGGKRLAVGFIEAVDLFLLGTVFYVIALGLYELFVDDRIPVPRWLEIHTLDDLKHRLIGVVVVVLGVIFLGEVITEGGSGHLFELGAAIGLVIAALSLFLRLGIKKE